MRVQIAATARDVRPDEALRWWTDFQDGPGDHAFVRGADRRVLARDEKGAVLEERIDWLGVRVWHEKLTTRTREDRVEFDGENGFSRFEGAYRFLPDPKGTRIELDARIDLKPPWRLGAFAAPPLVKGILKADLRGHVRQLRGDLRRR